MSRYATRSATRREADGLRISNLSIEMLENIFVYCGVRDLLELCSTCRSFREVILSSQKIWLWKLKKEYSMSLKVLPRNETSIMQYATDIFKQRSSDITFRGLLCTGGIDADASHYWVDNLFSSNKIPYCSAVGSNANCLGLLLDGSSPIDRRYQITREYMAERCTYPATVFFANREREVVPVSSMVSRILSWSDLELEGFFESFVASLQRNEPSGYLLLHDVGRQDVQTETRRLFACARYLQDRRRMLQARIWASRPRVMGGANQEDDVDDSGPRNLLLDVTLLDQTKSRRAKENMALIQKISLSRVGALTCPVRSGAVFVGIVDRCRLATYSPPDAAQMLHAAVTAPACAAFDSLTDSDMVVEASEEGRLPPIVVTDEFPAGLIHEFSTDPDDLPAAWTSPESDQPIISLRPLLWFSYKSRREFAEFVVKYKSLALTYLGKSRVRHRGPKPASPMVGTIHLPDVSIVEDRWRGLANRTSTSGQGGAEIPSSSGDSFVSSDESSMEEAETTDPSEEHSLADDGGSSSDGGDGASVGSDVGGSDHADGDAGGAGQSDEEFTIPGGIDARRIASAMEGLSESGESESSSDLGGMRELEAFLEVPMDDNQGRPADDNAPWPGMDEERERDERENRTLARSMLHVELLHAQTADAIMIKLIDQENLMEAFDDTGPPNLDMTHVGIFGKITTVPKGLTVKY